MVGKEGKGREHNGGGREGREGSIMVGGEREGKGA